MLEDQLHHQNPTGPSASFDPRWRQFCQLTLILFAGLLLYCLRSPAAPVNGRPNDPDLNLDALRSFLTEPPRIKSLLLRRTLAVAPISFREKRHATDFLRRMRAGQIVAPGLTSLYEIRLQKEPAAFLLRALQDETDLLRPDAFRLVPLAGRYETNWWSILDTAPPQIQMLRSPDGKDVAAGGVTNSYHLENERWATEFLRLGMLDVLTGDLQWSDKGDSFVGRTETGISCKGVLSLDRISSAIQLDLSYAEELQGRHIRIVPMRVEGQWVPRVVSVDSVIDAQGTRTSYPYATYESLQVRLSSVAIGREYFSPEPFLRTNDLWVEIEKGEFYWLENVGTNVVRHHAPRRTSGWDMKHFLKVLFFGALTISGVALAVEVFLRGTIFGNQRRPSNRETEQQRNRTDP